MAVVAVAVSLALVLLTGVAASRQPAEASTTRSRLPPLLDCGPAPPVVTPDETAFRANVLSLLLTIPSAAADAPAGTVTARSGTAFARALCFGAAANRSSSGAAAAGCRACLSAAASDAIRGCGATSRRAGVWRAGCFLGYADTAAASAREDAFRGRFYAAAGPTSTTATLEGGVCAGDRTGAPADCARCLEDSARAAAALRWPVRMRGEEVIVVGYGCCLRVRISVLPMRSQSAFDPRDIRQFLFVLWMLCMVAAELAIVAWLLGMIVINLGDIPQPIQ